MTHPLLDNVRRRLALSGGILREARSFVFFAALVFAVGVVVGLGNPNRFESLLQSFGAMAREFEGHGVLALIGMIFLRNLTAAFFAMWTGALLGILPFLAALANGVVLGALLAYVEGAQLLKAVLSLVPHGIFELPAMFISWGLGFWRGAWLFRKEKSQGFGDRAGKAYRVFFSVVVPLLAAAAVIEGLAMSILSRP